jgi:sugar fermentation stimulation protein A
MLQNKKLLTESIKMCPIHFGPLIKGQFVNRDNRFRVQVQVGVNTVAAHLPNPGRLEELLIPGRDVWLKPVENPKRRTAYSLSLIAHQGRLVSVNSHLPNYLVAKALECHQITIFEAQARIQREVRFGNSRIDFLVQEPRAPCWLEVKSVTLVVDQQARFPDAPTSRGSRHLRELMHAVNQGQHAMVLFVVQRDDAISFAPQDETDPTFGQTLRAAAQAGVEVRAVRCAITHQAIWIRDEIPVCL